MAGRCVVLLLALAAVIPLALGGPTTFFDRYERMAPAERACIGGVGNRTNLFDIVRRDCCSIPRARLAGSPEGIDPCPLNQPDIINGIPGLSRFRNLIVVEGILATDGPEAAGTTPEVVEAFTQSQTASGTSYDPDTFLVSNTRIWRTKEGLVCFCPIAEVPKEDCKKHPIG